MRHSAARPGLIPPRAPQAMRPKAAFVPEETRAALTFGRDVLLPVGFLIYGAVRLAAESFYGALGADPAEVGLGYVELLSRAAVGLVPIGLLFVGYGAILKLITDIPLPKVYRFFTRRSLPTPWPVPLQTPRHPILGLVAYFLGGLFVYAGTLYVELPDVAIALALFFPIGLGQAYYRRARLPQTREYSRKHLLPAILLATAAAIIGVSFAASRAGAAQAERIQEGKEFQDNDWFSVMPVNADCVVVSWIGKGPPAALDLDSPLLLLGSANGTTVFYGASEGGTTIRIPSASIVSTSTAGSGCLADA